MRAQIRRSPRRTNNSDIRSLTSLIQHVKRVGSSFDACDYLLPGPLPASLRVPQVRNMFMGTERVGLGDARYLHICHLRFLSALALIDLRTIRTFQNFRPLVIRIEITRGQFQVHVTQFEFRGLVLDAQIGYGNLSIHNLEVVLFGDLALTVQVVFFRSQEGQIAIQIPFEFIVEEHADYRPRAMAEKAAAGFSLYGHSEDASRLRRVLDEREITAGILTL
jgi:hypothetical protein